MILFAITGITLNHAADIGSKPQIVHLERTLPAALAQQVANTENENPSTTLAPELQDWLNSTFSISTRDKKPEWSDDEVYIPLPQPGGDAWIRIDRNSGAVEYEHTDRGWISWLNDLHKGRHTGFVWSLFIDIFSIACLIFSITGLLLLKTHASNRAMTWPLVGGGLVIPALLVLLFMH